MDLMIGMTEATTKKRPEYFEKNFPKFKSLFRNMNFWYDMSQLYKKLDMAPVLAHGDFWMNNLMWKKNSDGSASNELVAVIDWQITHSGCCGEDLARAIMLCTEGDTRRQYEMDIVKLYYSTLTQLLKQGGMTEPPFTFEQVVKAYQVCCIYQMVQLIMGAAFIINSQPPDTDAKLKAEREEKVLMRAKMALEDATEYAEKLFPEILDSV